MYNKPKKKVNFYKYLILIVLIIAIILVFNKNNIKNMTVFSKIKNSSYNIIKIIKKPFSSLGDYFSNIKNYTSLVNENNKLKKKANSLESYKTKISSLEEEIKTLKEEKNLNNIYTSYDIITATVIMRSDIYWFNNLIIDKGSKDNKKVDDLVVDQKGLIGKISSVTDNTSTIKLITNNDDNKLSVKVIGENNNYIAKVKEYKDNYLVLEGLSKYDNIKENAKVVTSGYGTFTGDILIGNIEKIESDTYDMSKIVYVKPAATFTDLKYVTILKNK